MAVSGIRTGLCLVIVSIVLVNSYCPNRWIRFDNSCYLFENQQLLPWHQALNVCVGLNANLVKIENKLEHNFIKAEIAKLQPQTKDEFWTAGNDIQIENHWVWAKSNNIDERMRATFWPPDEPNQDGDEDCLSYYYFEWNDESCGNLCYFICELDDTDTTHQGQIIG